MRKKRKIEKKDPRCGVLWNEFWCRKSEKLNHAKWAKRNGRTDVLVVSVPKETERHQKCVRKQQQKKTDRNNNARLISCMHLNKRCVCAIASAFRRNVSILIIYYCKMQIAICFREIYVSILVLFHAATISAAFLLCVDPANGHVRAAFCKQTNK